ncbi:ankyrin repeat, PH and SEC7 domain containing protein secG-like isoform X2 [Panonychus citri]|uniref:ankyrin repeat, PH and SEC7 domain containing protein secG-like isoform X2 n=1 Tax=Panonychus citri TaxID=50023 RepID=UPI0023076417|nr:ankyrin repeat, PH and SEC7 domain containing protein secG-like isoform X2 [Panonychus citri]
MVTYDDINSNLSWMADRFMIYAARFLLTLLVNVSESKDNLLTSAIHIVSLYYGSMFRYTKKSLLDVAIEQGNPEAVKCLVDLGEPIDRLNFQGKSPLHLAVIHGQLAIVEYLLNKGADSNCLTLPITNFDDNYTSAVDGAVETYNQTPLHLAITTGNESIVQCFINHYTNQSTSNEQQFKINLNIKNSEGLTPLCLAKKLNNQFIESLLEDQMTNDLDGEQLNESRAINYESTPSLISPSTMIASHVQPFVSMKLNYQEKMKRVEEADEEEEIEEQQEKETKEKVIETKTSANFTDKKEDNCLFKKESDQSTTSPLVKLIQRRDPLSRLLNLHLRMKSDDEIRYDNKLVRSPNSPPNGYTGRRKVSFVTEYFEKIESRRESLYRTESGRWPTPDSSCSIVDNNYKIFSDEDNNNSKTIDDCDSTKIINETLDRRKSLEPLTIHEAAARGVVEVIALHLSQRVAVDMIDTDGNTPLHYAARAGKAEAVKFLLSKGANLKYKNSEGRNALHVACFSGHEETLRQLILLEGIDLEVKDNEKNTPLIIASSLGHLKLVQLLTFSGAQVNVRNERKQTPIHKAAFNGFTEVVDHLVVKGGQVNMVDSEKDTPLHLAAHKGHMETVRILLDYGATPDVKNKLKRRPIHEAAYNGSVEVLNLLLSHKTNINSRDKNGDSALNLAAAMGHVPIIELLLDKGARINPKKDKTNSALHMATINEHLETLELLLTRKANVAVRDKKNDTPLHFACSQGNAIIVQTLLNCGSPINAKGSLGRTPLHLAVLNDQTKIIRLLLEKGADKMIKDSDGKTALRYAKLKGYSEAVQELTD